MATYDLWEQARGKIVQQSVLPGSNWWFFRVDFSQIPLNTSDVIRLCEIKDNWILKCGFSREYATSADASSVDFGTATGGNQIDNDIAIDSASDTWIRSDTLDDDGPIIIGADGHLFITMRDANCDSGILDLMIEVVIPPALVDSFDQTGG